MKAKHTTYINMSGKVFATEKGFLARPHGLGMEHARRFHTKGDAVAYNRRMKALLERVRR